MKYPYYDPETNKEYDCENEYEFRIKSFTEKHDYNFWDDEVEWFSSLDPQQTSRLSTLPLVII